MIHLSDSEGILGAEESTSELKRKVHRRLSF